MHGRPPRPASTVTHASPDDAEDLFRFLRVVRSEIGDGNVDEDLLADMAWALANRHGGTAMIVRGERGIEGSIGIRAERLPLARTHFLRSIWFVVAPEALLTGHTKSLLGAARGFAERVGRPLVIEEFSNPAAFADRHTGSYNLRFQRAERRVRFLGRHMRPVGVIFGNMPADAA